jgi:hypothetical protein
MGRTCSIQREGIGSKRFQEEATMEGRLRWEDNIEIDVK